MSHRTYCQGVPFINLHTYIIVLTSIHLFMYTKKPPDKSLEASFTEAEEARIEIKPHNILKERDM